MGIGRSMLEFEILARGLYHPDQLDITYDPSLCMHISPAIQAWMDTLWQQKLDTAQKKAIPLFDSQLFRLVSTGARADRTLHLVLGNTSYKEYVTTREPEFARGRARQELDNALSVCSVVETNDGYILLDKRQGVDVYEGRYHVIGGFFERDLDMATTQPDPFSAICREIREETGIQLKDISEQYCLGVVYDLTTPHAEMCFLTRLNISLEEVYRRVPEEKEIQQLLSLYITKGSLLHFVLANHGNISATGEPKLLMYGELRFGEEWFGEAMRRLSSFTLKQE